MFNISLGTTVYGMNVTMPKENDYSELEKYIKDEMKSSLIPGAAVSIIKEIKATKPAGRSWEYSNLNFILIGAIIEAVSGESYADYLRENILIQKI